jgi:hypothetical protein
MSEATDILLAEWGDACYNAQENYTIDPHAHIERLVVLGDRLAALAAAPAPVEPLTATERDRIIIEAQRLVGSPNRFTDMTWRVTVTSLLELLTPTASTVPAPPAPVDHGAHVERLLDERAACDPIVAEAAAAARARHKGGIINSLAAPPAPQPASVPIPDQCRVGESMADDYFQHAAECPECEAHEAARIRAAAPAPRKLTADEVEHLMLMGLSQDGTLALGEGAAERVFALARRLATAAPVKHKRHTS